MLANLFWRIKRFKATKFQIEVLVAMNRWAEVGSLLYIICALETCREHRVQLCRFVTYIIYVGI